MRALMLKGLPEYSEGYRRIDVHYPWEEPVFETLDHGADEDYLDVELPEHIALNARIMPLPIENTVTATLIYDGEALPSRPLYPTCASYFAGIKLVSDGCGFYMCNGTREFFSDYTLAGTEIDMESSILYHKRFLAPTGEIRQQRAHTMPLYELFPYAGVYESQAGIESICQVYGALLPHNGQTLIHVKTAKGWYESGQRISACIPALTEDIMDGTIVVTLKKEGLLIPYRSRGYQEVGSISGNIIIHFTKQI